MDKGQNQLPSTLYLYKKKFIK